jgi:competence protein ComEA
MSINAVPGQPPIAADARPLRPAPVLPWSWPEGARVLLAVLAIAAAVGLALGRRGRPQAMQPDRATGPVPVTVSELRLDPSTATPEALETLPRIGPALARRIVEARADGPFRSPDDLCARVRGIGPVTLAQIKPYLEFGVQTEDRLQRDAPATAIVDAGAASARSSRKPPRSATRKAKGSAVRLAAKAGTGPSP